MRKLLLFFGVTLIAIAFLDQAMIFVSDKVNIFNPDPLAGYDWAFDQVYTESGFTHKIGTLGFYSDNTFALSIYNPKDFDKKELERKGTYSFNRTIQYNALILESSHGKQLFRYTISDRKLILSEVMDDSYGNKRVSIHWILKR